MQSRRSTISCLLMSCNVSYAMNEKLYRKFPDQKGRNLRKDWDACPVIAPATALFGARYEDTKLNKI